jgi:HEPN domain-containing protein
VTRSEFQQLADERAKDAEILLDAQRWNAASYLAGYAVECGLKACIAKMFKAEDIPHWSYVKNIFIHDLEKLLERAGLEQKMVKNSPTELNWRIVAKWSEETRYELGTAQLEATELFNAVTDATNGVLPWLKRFW